MRIELETLVPLRQFAHGANVQISLRTFGRGFVSLPRELALAWVGDEMGSEAGGIWTCRADSEEVHTIIVETL